MAWALQISPDHPGSNPGRRFFTHQYNSSVWKKTFFDLSDFSNFGAKIFSRCRNANFLFPPYFEFCKIWFLRLSTDLLNQKYKIRIASGSASGNNRASTELWNAQALCQCNIAPPVLTGTQCLVLSTWGLGSGLASLVSCLGNALGVVGDKKVLN